MTQGQRTEPAITNEDEERAWAWFAAHDLAPEDDEDNYLIDAGQGRLSLARLLASVRAEAAAAEREACLMACAEVWDAYAMSGQATHGISACRAAIRRRGNDPQRKDDAPSLNSGAGNERNVAEREAFEPGHIVLVRGIVESEYMGSTGVPLVSVRWDAAPPRDWLSVVPRDSVRHERWTAAEVAQVQVAAERLAEAFAPRPAEATARCNRLGCDPRYGNLRCMLAAGHDGPGDAWADPRPDNPREQWWSGGYHTNAPCPVRCPTHCPLPSSSAAIEEGKSR